MAETIFTIAGMHRSGTSLFAHWLHESNVFLGERLYGATSTNQKGHFEDMDFLELHKQDLLDKGLDVSGLFNVSSAISLEKASRIKVEEIIQSRKGNSYWGWKEPRTTLYLSQYKNIIPELKVIAVFRQPEKVVNSLYSRLKKNKPYYTRNPFRKFYWWLTIDLMPRIWIEKFKKATDSYHKAIVDFFDEYPTDTMILHLDDIIRNPQDTAKKINEFLCLETPLVPFENVFSSNLLSMQNQKDTVDEMYIALEKRKTLF